MSTATITASTAKKIRSDSKLERLSAEQQEHLRSWLDEENLSYRQVADLVRTRFGLSVSKSALGTYYQRHIAPERYEDEADTAAAFAALPVAEFDAATINRAKALAFGALTHPLPNVDFAARLLNLVHRVQKQAIAEKRLALEERRVALRESLAAHPPRRPRASSPDRGTHAPPPPPSASVTSVPPPCSPCPNSSSPTTPASLPLPPNPDSSFPSFSSVQPLPPSPAPSQNSPVNPPLFPASSSLSQPPAPLPSPSPQTPPAPPVQPPAPLPSKPKPRIPYREVTRAEWG